MSGLRSLVALSRLRTPWQSIQLHEVTLPRRGGNHGATLQEGLREQAAPTGWRSM